METTGIKYKECILMLEHIMHAHTKLGIHTNNIMITKTMNSIVT